MTAEEEVPTWATQRNIDGHDYELNAVYAYPLDAHDAVIKHREEGKNAQAFTSKFLKADPFAEEINGLMLAGRAAVYIKDRARKNGKKTATKKKSAAKKKSGKKKTGGK